MSRSASISSRLFVALLASALTGLLLAGVALPVVGGLGLAAKAGADEFLVLPDNLLDEPPALRSRILAADGSLIATLYKENRINAPLSTVPELTRKAVIAIEDARFYAHNGIDYKGTARAALENLKANGVSQGGSTLTQQYVKNALIQAAGSSKTAQEAARAQTVDRKLKEARYALALDGGGRLSKDEILERYLNINYYGNGVYGIGTAANFYFGKAVKDLTLSEGATLAGIVQSPGRFDPVKAQKDKSYLEAVIQRRNLVLTRMATEGFITEADRAKASAERSQPGRPLFTIKPVVSGCENPAVRFPYFCDYVRRALEDTDLGKALGKTREERQNALLGGGLTIRTSLDPTVQLAAQRAVEETVPPADPFQAAAVANVIEPGTGRVKAMAVNRRYTEKDLPGHTKVNLAIGGSSGFQAGSTFKAFVLAEAIKQGIPLGFTLYAPQKYTSKVFKNYTADGIEPYTLQNAGDSESGTFTLEGATHDSVNTYFIQLEERVGVEPAAALAESMGVRQFQSGRPTGQLLRGGSFVLGTNEVSPLAMAAAYATFAARGLFCGPTPVDAITDRNNEKVALSQPGCTQVLDAEIADTVSSVLRGVIDGSTPGRTGRSASIGRPAAGKTGTTNGSRAAWFIGYTPQLATAVWVGYPGSGVDDPVKEMRNVRINGRFYRQVYGGTIPAVIWRRTMQMSLDGVDVVDFERPGRSAVDGRTIVVPSVRGLPVDEARRVLTEAGFAVRDGGRVPAAPIRSGQAAYTSPSSGRERSFGSSVTLYESTGRYPTKKARPVTRAPQTPAPAAPVEPVPAAPAPAAPAAPAAAPTSKTKKAKAQPSSGLFAG